MPSSTGPKPSGVRRVIFREFLPGDRRKKDAESADASSGGGARDLRLSPGYEFDAIVKAMFPQSKQVQRKRGGVTTALTIQVGTMHWLAGTQHQSVDVEFEPPTDARPGEWRLTKIPAIPPLTNPPPSSQGLVFILLVENDQGEVWPCFATLVDLQAGKWHGSIAGPILHAYSNRSPSKASCGHMDFVAGTQWTS